MKQLLNRLHSLCHFEQRSDYVGAGVFKVATQKLLSKAGDSLTEILVAVLIAAMGAATLGTMTLSASSLTGKNESMISALYASEQQIATSSERQSAQVQISGAALGQTVSVPVWVYTDENNDLKRFKLQ